jgi:hypothetical protein
MTDGKMRDSELNVVWGSRGTIKMYAARSTETSVWIYSVTRCHVLEYHHTFFYFVNLILDALAELRKAIVSFVMSVRLSVRME